MSLAKAIAPLSQLSLFSGASCVGVDVGSQCVKVALCAGKSIPISIKKCLLQKTGPELSSGRFKLNLVGAGLGNKSSAFSIADEKVENYEFKLPKLKPKELNTAIDWEIKKAVTSPEFAFHDLITIETELGFDIQCVVASKDIVTSKYDEGKSFGMNPSFLETESSALLAAAKVAKKGPINKVVIMDLGYSAFRLIFIHHSKVSFTRSLYLGLGPIIDAVVAQGSNPMEVEALFKELKLTEEGEAPQQLLPAQAILERSLQETLYTLCEEFRRSEFFAKDQKGLEEPDEILLCGGGACIPYTATYLSRHLQDKKISVLDPFKWTNRPPSGVDLSSGPIWACAVGLSLRGVV